MSNRRFLSIHTAIDNRILLTDDELHQLKTVNGIKRGDEIEVIDGKGTLYFGKIRTINDLESEIKITREEKENKSQANILIAPSIIKKKAMSVMIEKLTEMGVDVIRPVIFSRTDEKYISSMLKKWQRIALQSLKVNKRLWPTEIYPPVSLQELIETAKDARTKILLDVEGQINLPSGICGPVLSIIGPPRDFSPEEKELLLEEGFIQIKINDGLLKTETAAISIAAILSVIKVVESKQ